MGRTDDRYLAQLKSRYRKASKKERSAILDEFVKTTGYHRKHAIAVLNGRRERVQGPIRRPRRRVYGAEETDALAVLATLFDHVCSKLLGAAVLLCQHLLCQHGLDNSAPEISVECGSRGDKR